MVFNFVAPDSRPSGVVRLSGPIDVLAAAEFRTKVQGLVDRGWFELVVDLSAVPRIDCSGVGALICGLKATREVGGDCRLASATEPVRGLISLCGLDRVLTAYPSVEDALEDYQVQQGGQWQPFLASL